MTVYVVGFLFSEDREWVALIQKARPDWQRHRLNGIGGTVERDEDCLTAMRREFREETGQDHDAWTLKAMLYGPSQKTPQWSVVFYCATAPIEKLYALKNDGDEPIHVVPVQGVLRGQTSALFNLTWLIPLCLDQDVVDATVVDCTVAGRRVPA